MKAFESCVNNDIISIIVICNKVWHLPSKQGYLIVFNVNEKLKSDDIIKRNDAC